jgi:hypothetical protein
MHRIPFLILLALPPTIGWGQPAIERKVMDLVRVYEQAQDSVFAPGNTASRVVFLENQVQAAQTLHQAIRAASDSNLVRVSGFLMASVEAFGYGARYDLERDTGAFSRLFAHRNDMAQFDSAAFPLRFSVMGYAIVMRYADLRPVSLFYWKNVVSGCNCGQLRSVLSQIQNLNDDNLQTLANKRRKTVCKRRKPRRVHH